jgi:hypothetical protein
MSFQFSQVVSELVEAISVRADAQVGQDGFVDVAGAPAGYSRSGATELPCR